MNLNLFDEFSSHERENNFYQPPMNNENYSEIPRFPNKTPLAMAYVPFQQWEELYDADKALNRGTLFPELDLPFEGDCKDE